jgi:hypothetical protein
MGLSRLSKKHQKMAWLITESLVTNEPYDQWQSKIPEYLISVKDYGDATDETLSLAAQHSVAPVMGAILLNSVKEEE